MFGRHPSGTRAEQIQASPNYRDGQFQNIHPTPSLTEGVTYFDMLKDFFLTKHERLRPIDIIPNTKTDLKNLDPKENILVWFGHSSYFMQIDGKRILVDPVLSGRASPIPCMVTAFAGSDRYSVDDLPDIDILFITHDHWDHIDYHVLLDLQKKVNIVITGLGVGEHLESWGYRPEQLIEKDWNEDIFLSEGWEVTVLPARHFSGRGLKRNQSLWSAYRLKTPSKNIFIGGDSGYDTTFAQIGEDYGPFDLAILENGQYDHQWAYIHMMPEEVIQASRDLRAEWLFPVHSAKFVLANHPWDEPLVRISELAKTENIPLMTPIIGEKVNLENTVREFDTWWKNIQ